MTYTIIHNKANNGMTIKSTISLVGGKKNCWQANVAVDDCPMATSHHDTRESAENWLQGMHDAYLEVHSKSN